MRPLPSPFRPRFRATNRARGRARSASAGRKRKRQPERFPHAAGLSLRLDQQLRETRSPIIDLRQVGPTSSRFAKLRPRPSGAVGSATRCCTSAPLFSMEMRQLDLLPALPPRARPPRSPPLPYRFRPRPRPTDRARDGIGVALGPVRVGEAEAKLSSRRPVLFGDLVVHLSVLGGECGRGQRQARMGCRRPRMGR